MHHLWTQILRFSVVEVQIFVTEESSAQKLCLHMVELNTNHTTRDCILVIENLEIQCKADSAGVVPNVCSWFLILLLL